MHRGLFFSFSPAQKRGMCEDVFSAQLYINTVTETESSEKKTAKMVISDASKTVQDGVEAKYPLFWRRTGVTPWSEPEWGISYECFGKNFQKRWPTNKLHKINSYHLYSAFYPKWLYSARQMVSMNQSFSLSNFITLSPDYVEQQQPELARRYVNTRANLSKTCCRAMFQLLW